MFKYARKNINKWLNNNNQLHFIITTSIWHNDVFYVHIIIYLKLRVPPATSTSWPVRDLSSPRVGNPRVGVSASCPVTAMNPLEAEFENFPASGLFKKCKKIKKQIFNVLRLHVAITPQWLMIIDRRKFITMWSLYRMSSFHFYHWNQLKSFPWPVRSVQETSSNFVLRRTRDNADISQSQAASDDQLLSHLTLAASNAGSKQLGGR